MKRYAVFLDRDGIINKHRTDYVKNLEEFEILPGVQKYLKKLSNLGFKLIVVTNQSAVNRGLMTTRQLTQIHEHLIKKLAEYDCQIDDIFFCPHRPDENCGCRKPKVKLFLLAAKKHNIDLNKSWVIGDNETDIQAGKRIGCRTIEMDTNKPLNKALNIIRSELRKEAS